MELLLSAFCLAAETDRAPPPRYRIRATVHRVLEGGARRRRAAHSILGRSLGILRP